jgi:Cu/Ag efflux pump CusA
MPIIEALPSVTCVRSSLGSGPPKLQFVPDEEKVRAAGLTLDEVALYLQATLEGAEGGSLIEGPLAFLRLWVSRETSGPLVKLPRQGDSSTLQ